MSSGQSADGLGIRENVEQFTLYLGLVLATGLVIGSEQTVVPLLAEAEYRVESLLLVGSFVASFGFVKALLNLFAGR